MSLYIYLLYNIYHLCFTCIDFYDLSAWVGCWFVVYIRRFIHKFLNVCPFYYTAVAGSGKVGPVNQVNHTSWVDVVTPTDRPKSVLNRCVIETFVALFVLSLCPFDRGFYHRTKPDLFLFLLSSLSSFVYIGFEAFQFTTVWVIASQRMCGQTDGRTNKVIIIGLQYFQWKGPNYSNPTWQ